MPRGVPKSGKRKRRNPLGKAARTARTEKTYKKYAAAGGRGGLTWNSAAKRRNAKGATKTYRKNINRRSDPRKRAAGSAAIGAIYGNTYGGAKGAAAGAVIGAGLGVKGSRNINKVRSGVAKYEAKRSDSVIGKGPKKRRRRRSK